MLLSPKDEGGYSNYPQIWITFLINPNCKTGSEALHGPWKASSDYRKIGAGGHVYPGMAFFFLTSSSEALRLGSER